MTFSTLSGYRSPHPNIVSKHMKTCRKCGFLFNERGCPKCAVARSKRWRLANPDRYRLLIRTAQKRSYRRDPEKGRLKSGQWKEYRSKWCSDRPERLAVYQKKHHAKYPLRWKARYTANNALSKGKISRQSVCSKCGISEGLEKHHPDYTNPLRVIWLCEKCHSCIHRKY